MMKNLLVVCFFLLISVLVSGQSKKTMQWYNAPGEWKFDDNKITVTTDTQTDFWRTTFYKYIKDNGHFYYEEKEGDFESIVKVIGSYADLYDQAGLMIRIDSAQWIKSGVEFVNGGVKISAVVTRGFSDWSVISLKEVPAAVWLKLVRKQDSIELSYSLDGKEYIMTRLGYFPPKVKAKIGIMAAAPDGKGFNVTFEDFKVKAVK